MTLADPGERSKRARRSRTPSAYVAPSFPGICPAGDHGCIAPTWADAAAEGLKRAAADLA